jgi:hypothetical protein
VIQALQKAAPVGGGFSVGLFDTLPAYLFGSFPQ